METAILLVAILAAAGACPLVCWLQRRRGRAASCCAAPAEQGDELARLRAEREEVDRRIAALEGVEEPGR